MVYKTKIAVLRGGVGHEYAISMKNGANVINNLSLDKYIIYDVQVSPKDVWYLNGVEIFPENLFKMVDFVFNALQGDYDSGRIQKVLTDFGIPYTGSDSVSSAVASNKYLTKKIYESNGIKTPYYKIIRKDNYNSNLLRDMPMPCIVKPVNLNSSVGIFVAENIYDLIDFIEKSFDFSDSILIEEFISGKEVSCGVIDNFRNSPKYSLVPIEFSNENEKIFTYENKYNGNFKDLTFKILNQKEKEQIQKIAIEAHNLLGLRHYSDSNFIIHPKRGIFLIETNTSPSLHKDALFTKSLELVGSSLEEFLDHIIETLNPKF